ncbi:endonuclease [Streptomonospora nanhaiensis]|uniref:endonuclease n=1 Tax=Streptomonospora nanhaiensis TaxID=1323731 RepID=UPI001C99ABF7|nr:endonuclease [Streptomonospora nanhaiensis]MBX9387501.1 endonuclease [Streptomonospora nanhaiensis]
MAAEREKTIARAVLAEGGPTLARQAGIRLADRPAPLWQLLVVVNLVSARISADIAVAAARELFAAGGTTPRGMAELSWQERVDALGRGHYVRYDESTATRLGECADLAGERYGGDLRRMREAAQRRRTRLAAAVQEFPGIGPTGAAVFCREAQAVWPWLRPYADRRARTGADRVGLPPSPERLGGLVEGEEMAALTAGLVRAARDADLARRVREAA